MALWEGLRPASLLANAGVTLRPQKEADTLLSLPGRQPVPMGQRLHCRKALLSERCVCPFASVLWCASQVGALGLVGKPPWWGPHPSG